MATITAIRAQTTMQATSTVEVVRRTPFYFESQHQWLFGWLHQRDLAAHANHGAIICPPFGHEQIHAHRGLRHLADALAQAEFPVMRFNYHGTGDSDGSDEDPERYATWLANIRDAVLWMQRQLNCQRISLIGVRLGALLTAQVANELAVDGLLLWAPVLKGRLYMREMKALSLMASDAVAATEAPEDIEAAGFVLTSQTTKDLSQLDLLQAHPHCRRALILTREDSPADTRLLEHFQALGIETVQIGAPGFEDMMAEPHYTKVPSEAIAHGVDWLRAGTLGEECPRETRCRDNPGPREVTLAQPQPIRERSLSISQQPDLFGILSESREALAGDRPYIVLLNAGSCYRVGPNRLYVFLARLLAAQGFRCLRLDVCGLGDSVVAQADQENHPYPATVFRDIELTLDYLQTHCGARQVVLLGLCSGAYAAFQAAAQLSHPALVESVLINPLTYYWKEGLPLEVAGVALQLKTFQEAMASMWHPLKWLKLFSGRSKIGLFGALKLLVNRWRLRRHSGRATAAQPDAVAGPRAPAHPPQEDIPGDLERIEKAGRHLACFFSTSDPGYGLLMLHGSRKVEELRRKEMLKVFFIDQADHTFSRRTPSLALGQALSEYLGQRFPRTTEKNS